MTSVPMRLGTFGVLAGVVPIELEEANALCDEWGHAQGACLRPFRSEAFALDVAGEPVAIAITASTVSATAAGFERGELIELARLCSRERWATRPMLRLWREVCGPAYACWTPRAAIAYSQSRRHNGDIYRFDGWELVSEDAGSSGGGTWTKPRAGEHVAAGKKRCWLWRY